MQKTKNEVLESQVTPSLESRMACSYLKRFISKWKEQTIVTEIGFDPSVEPDYAMVSFMTMKYGKERRFSIPFEREVNGVKLSLSEFVFDMLCCALFYKSSVMKYLNEHFKDKVKALKKEGLSSEEIEKKLQELAVRRALSSIEKGEGHYTHGGLRMMGKVRIEYLTKEEFAIEAPNSRR